MQIELKRGEQISISAPAGATQLFVAGAGKRIEPIDVVDGTAVLTSATTETMPPGEYMTEWKVVDADGSVRLPDGCRITVSQSLATDHDELRTVPVTQYERILAAAKDALESAAGDGAISVSTGESNFSFESRNELLSFVSRLEPVVALSLIHI